MTEIAQNRESEQTGRLRGLVNVADGRYIAIVGRQRSDFSLVQDLHAVGWSGVNITADAGGHANLLAERPRDRNLHAAVVSASTGTDQPGSGAGANGQEDGFSTAPLLTLADLHASGAGGDIHLLSIEADALVPAFLDAADFSTFRPWVVVIDLPTREDNLSESPWRTCLEHAGYDEVFSDRPALWFRARERGDLAFGPPRPGDARREIDPAGRMSSPGGGVEADHEAALDQEAALLALARARDDLDGMQARYAQEAKLHGALIERLRGELRDAQNRTTSLEALQVDSLRLARIAALLDGKLSAAIQNHGLETLQRGLAGQIGTWMAEMERDRADLLLRLEAEAHQRHAVLGSTSWRLTGPLRRLGRASRVALHQPRRLPMLLIRKLRPAAYLSGAEAPGAPAGSPAVGGGPFGLAKAAARIDDELMKVSELLQRLAAVAAGRDDGRHASASPPGSEAYRAMTHAGRLAAWIRHDAARQRADAP